MKNTTSNSFTFADTLKLFLIFSGLAGLLGQRAPAQEKRQPLRPRPISGLSSAQLNLQRAHEEFRRVVISAMQEAATTAGIGIRAKDAVAIALHDNIVAANAAIEGSERITIDELKSKGGELLFTFLHLPEDSQIPSGFYRVRFYLNQRSNKWTAQWKQGDGRVILETEAQVDFQSSGMAGVLKQAPMCTLGQKGELILFDDHDAFKNILTSLRINRGSLSGGGVPSRDPARQKIVHAANEFRTAATNYVEFVAREAPVIGSFARRYGGISPLSVAGQLVTQYNEFTERQTNGCKEIITLRCTRLIECWDGEGHRWGIMLTNPDCAEMGPIFF